MGRRPCCDKVGLKKGRWTAEEDHRLKNYILANGEGSWRSLPKNAGLLRCGKSCRLRWINYLRSDLKRGNFTTEEEDTIIKLNASLGNRWSLIASHLPGRTDNEIKNYWNSHLSRQIHTFRRRSGGDDGSVIVDMARLRLPPRRKGRRVRRIKEAETAADTGDRESPDEEIINEPTEGRREVGRFLSPSLNRDDMSLNLDELLNNVEMELDDNDDVIKMHEAVTCESNTTTAAAPAAVSDAGAAEMDTGGECSSICSSPFRLQSPWNWESFVGGQEWDAAEFIAAEDLAESDAVISWLLS